MKYHDRVYGEFEITEPVILKLLKSVALQRLKEIDTAGYRPLWVKPSMKIGRYDHSRFAHSIGVYLLLRKHNASIEEQIAGLIHDVSHSAFSHCIDYALDAGSEKEHSHQDNVFEGFIENTEIPQILKQCGFNPKYILDDSHFPLKENSLPDICADRIDYSLRTAVIFGEVDIEGKKYLLDNLTTESNRWVFRNFESAKRYAELFLRLNTVYYAGLSSAIMFRTVGDCLRYALQKGYISENDLYTTDEIVIGKIERFLNKNGTLKLLFDRMNNRIGVTNNPNDYDASVFCKSRVINPLCQYHEKLKRVSEIDHNWEKILEQESKPKQYFLKFDR